MAVTDEALVKAGALVVAEPVPAGAVPVGPVLVGAVLLEP